MATASDWFKLTADIRKNRKIKHMLRSLGVYAGWMWVELLCMARECNDGGAVYLVEGVGYDMDGLADELDLPVEDVARCLDTMQRLNMISVDGSGVIQVEGWAEYQNIEGMEASKEKNRQRQARFKERQRQADCTPCDNRAIPCDTVPALPVTPGNVTGNVIVTLPVTPSNAADIEIEKEKEEEKRVYGGTNAPMPPTHQPSDQFRGTTEMVDGHKPTKQAGTRARFVPPTREDVLAYCQERNNNVDVDKWLAHYTANGWKVGRNPMKDWKAAIRTWEQSSFGSGKGADNRGTAEKHTGGGGYQSASMGVNL